MRRAIHRGAVVAWTGFLVAGCPTTAADFDCTEDAQCTLDTVMGWCEPNRWCSFPAPECASGRRYGEAAGQGLSGQCVPDPGATSTQGETSSSDATSTTPDPAPTSTTTLTEETTSSTSDSTGSGSEASGSSSTGAPENGFFDDFDRPDSPDLGNGWIERTPGVWALQGNQVVFDGQAVAYQDSTFYRPFDEARLDVETSIEFRFVADVDNTTPQLHARIQDANLSEPMSTNAYLVYMPAADEIVLTRVEGDVFALSQSEAVSPVLEVGQEYRLTLRVTGTDPVELAGSVERRSEGDWSLLQSVALTDSDATRIVDPGSFGASGSFSVAFSYDNFSMTPL